MTFSFPRSRKTIVSDIYEHYEQLDAAYEDSPVGLTGLLLDKLEDLNTEWQSHPVSKLESAYLRTKFRVRDFLGLVDNTDDIPF